MVEALHVELVPESCPTFRHVYGAYNWKFFREKLCAVKMNYDFVCLLTLQLNQHHHQRNLFAALIYNDVMMALMVCSFRFQLIEHELKQDYQKRKKKSNRNWIRNKIKFRWKFKWRTCEVMFPLFWIYFEFHRHQTRIINPDVQLSRRLLQFFHIAGSTST